MNWSASVALGLALALNVLAASPSKSAECLTCHDQEGSSFQASVHGSLACNDCHTTFKAYPHAENPPKVKCETCHADPVSGMAGSVHASVNPQQQCKGCHGDPHGILPASNAKSSTYPSNLPRTCGTCHGDAKLTKQHGIKEVYSQYMDSIHGFALTKDGLLVAASCSSCHGSHKILSKKDPHSRTAHDNIPATCGTCHAGSQRAYLSGIHGQRMQVGNKKTPVCSDCHTAHEISRPRQVAWQVKTTATCGECHKREEETYRDTFHSQVSSLGFVETARCWDCHGEHEILPKTDPRSSIAAANLQATCGKCHNGVNASFVSYQPHADRHNRHAYPLLWISSISMNMLLASVLGFFILHTVLWLFRSIAERKEHLAPSAPGLK